MADSNRVLSALRNELVGLGLVRRPSDAGASPPMHVEPRGGPPAPGDREAPEDDADLTVTLRLSGELSEAPLDTYRRRVVADVVYRSRTTAGLKRARELDAAIRERLAERRLGDGVMLDEGGPAQTFALSATVFGGLGPVGETPDGTRTELAKYAIEVLA